MNYVLYFLYKALVPLPSSLEWFLPEIFHFPIIIEEKLIRAKNGLRWPGVEPGSTAWREAMLTVIPPSHFPVYKY